MNTQESPEPPTVLGRSRFLEGQVAIVTGAAWGIGRVIARHLLGAGAKVALADVDAAGLDDCRASIDPTGESTLAATTDIRSEEDVAKLVEATVEGFGRLDILVNNAGVYPTCDVVDMTVDEWDRVLDVNLKGTFLCAREAARAMIRQGIAGRIVNTASAAGTRGRPGKAAYCSSKAGVILFTKCLALELAAHGILVNAVSPGLVETELKQKALEESELERELHAAKLQRMLLGRACDPNDVAKGVLFLVSPDSSYTTGHVLFVDGGGTAGEVLRSRTLA